MDISDASGPVPGTGRRELLKSLGGAGLAGIGMAAAGSVGSSAAAASAPPSAPAAHLRSFYDVKDFGAVGDGRADDHAAIQAAIDKASAEARGLPQGGGGVVFLPSGLYRVGKTLRITTSNVGIQGIGAGSVVQGGSADGHIIYAGTSDPHEHPVRNVFFEHFAITAAVRKTSGAAIFCEYAERFRIEDVKAAPHEVGPGPLYDAFYFRGFDTCVLSNVMAIAHHKGVTLHGFGVQDYGGQFWLIGGSRVLSNLEPGSIGVHIGGSAGGVVIEDTDVIVNETNVLIDDSLSGSPNHQVFVNQCWIDSAGGHGLDVAPQGVGLLHLNNSWFSASGRNVLGTPLPETEGFPEGCNINYRGDATELGLGPLNTVIVDGCRIFNAFGSGIAAYAGKWIVTGSNILFNGLGKKGGHGIALLDPAVREAIITGNTVHNNGLEPGGEPRPLSDGIHVAKGVKNYIITNNIVRDNGRDLVNHGDARRIVKDNLLG